MENRAAFAKILVGILGIAMSMFVLVGCAQSDSEEQGSALANDMAADESRLDAGVDGKENADASTADAGSGTEARTEAGSNTNADAGMEADSDENTCDIVLNTNAADEVDGSYDGQLEDVKDAGEEPDNGTGL